MWKFGPVGGYNNYIRTHSIVFPYDAFKKPTAIHYDDLLTWNGFSVTGVFRGIHRLPVVAWKNPLNKQLI